MRCLRQKIYKQRRRDRYKKRACQSSARRKHAHPSASSARHMKLWTRESYIKMIRGGTPELVFRMRHLPTFWNCFTFSKKAPLPIWMARLWPYHPTTYGADDVSRDLRLASPMHITRQNGRDLLHAELQTQGSYIRRKLCLSILPPFLVAVIALCWLQETSGMPKHKVFVGTVGMQIVDEWLPMEKALKKPP